MAGLEGRGGGGGGGGILFCHSPPAVINSSVLGECQIDYCSVN